MAVGKEDRGQFWVDGQFTVRLRGLGAEPGRIIRIRRPFALIGRSLSAEIRIDDPSVDDRHAVLLLDARGIFGVDLLSRLGTRFAGADGCLRLARRRGYPGGRRPPDRVASASDRRVSPGDQPFRR